MKDLVGPLVDLPPIEQPEIKFNGRSRLYIGNLTSDVTEEEIINLFNQFGEAAELFLNKEKNFGFIKMVKYYPLLKLYLLIKFVYLLLIHNFFFFRIIESMQRRQNVNWMVNYETVEI